VRILVAGASGFVGRHLAPALLEAGHEVVAMTRRPQDYPGVGEPVAGDVQRPETLAGALVGCAAAYYLVHSLDRRDFRRVDGAAATAFGQAAADAGVRHIVYLGGLGDPADALSDHLRSRQECESLLGAAGVPVTTLRAGIVIGDQGTSWEIIRALVARVPLLAAPTWARTRTQPVAVADAVRYLIGVLEPDGARVFDIGGTEVLPYTDLLSRLSAFEGRPAVLVPVPAPSVGPAVRLAALLASRVLPVLTGVDRRTVRALIESMRNEVVVRDDAIRAVVPFQPMDYDGAVRAALQARAQRLGR
jgi:uncharacterized protein YbjT (DUF2867 family)